MVSKKITITNSQGMHMRPATVFAKEMMTFESDIRIHFGGQKIDGKSVMNLMAACMKFGSEIEICCDGADEQEALDKAIDLIESGLGD